MWAGLRPAPTLIPTMLCSAGAALVMLLLVFAIPARAEHYTAYAWADADLALIYPDGWDAPVATATDDALTLTLPGGDMTVVMAVLPISDNPDAGLRAALDAQVAAIDLLPLRYALDTLYGRDGLRVDAVSANRAQIGVGRAGRLPDDRGLVIVGRAPAADQAALESMLDTIFASLVFSVDAPPVPPDYHAVWSVPPGEQPVLGLAVSGDRLYALDVDGVRVYDAATGTAVASYPFEHPAQPSGIATDAAGRVYIGDTVCRCVLVMNAEGRWVDTLGTFGGGSPYSIAVTPDGTIYATDKSEAGYQLRIVTGSRSQTVGLNFNAEAPPLVAIDAAGQVWVVEWLNSLIDGSTSGAVSLVSGDKPSAELRFWLEHRSPDVITAMTATPDGDLAFASTDAGVLLVDSGGTIVSQIAPDAGLRRVAFGGDGALYAARIDGGITALTTRGLPDRFGGRALALGVPVVGTLNEAAPQQSWTYDGTAGERLTISSVDQTRTDVFQTGLDMALRLFAPDGSELAYNDDQPGDDLFGVYDAQIADFSLPQTGTYTVRVEWRQGQGMYTLGVSGGQTLELSADGVTRFDGELQDVFPVQDWRFDARAGDVLTITMTTEAGTLDPALVLRSPSGDLIGFNDDAADPELDVNAQLTQLRLSTDGTYTLEASRFEGSGRYHIVIVNTG